MVIVLVVWITICHSLIYTEDFDPYPPISLNIPFQDAFCKIINKTLVSHPLTNCCMANRLLILFSI
jgi:hypothetical protein